MSLDYKNKWNKKLSLRGVKHNDLMNEKYKTTCEYLNYVEHLLILASTVTGCISNSAFPYKSIIKKKKKKHHKIVLLAKFKLNSIEVLIFKILLAGDKLIPKLHLKQPGFT